MALSSTGCNIIHVCIYRVATAGCAAGAHAHEGALHVQLHSPARYMDGLQSSSNKYMTRINDLAVLMVLRSASEWTGLQCSAEPMSVALSECGEANHTPRHAYRRVRATKRITIEV